MTTYKVLHPEFDTYDYQMILAGERDWENIHYLLCEIIVGHTNDTDLTEHLLRCRSRWSWMTDALSNLYEYIDRLRVKGLIAVIEA
jgi:hypothetical protein